ncbi:mannose-1-phosphate guanylyltransferase [Jeongeupia sp. HS-3]|uniref:N-acetylmuramate alpha-1-phosphate uridylyltransferase MurU n=1 Tax=Jeongeupia sp. HS-3 TaxID=1009682 RepID=UPI0018A5C424|nr:nucleotidyltransferase family protein [Jeongeupia sp. HS-3]BCL76393.1 mannose-1-phosphate guanylyltransferase [Jeongeupia sp. HS-3]
MKAMILAAGRGERMRPLTDTCPKPLLDVAGTPLIGWHLKRLAAAGITEVVINHAWLGAMIENALGDGSAYGVRIAYSAENTALETAGGIAQALPLLGDAPFAVINGDIFTDYDFAALVAVAERMRASDAVRAHLVLTPKAGYPTGRDLAIGNGLAMVCAEEDAPMTFCGIAVYRPDFFADVVPGQASPLLPHFLTAMAEQQVSAECFGGLWLDVGTMDRLEYAGEIARNHTSGV